MNLHPEATNESITVVDMKSDSVYIAVKGTIKDMHVCTKLHPKNYL